MTDARLDDPSAAAVREWARARGMSSFCGCDPRRCVHRFPERPNLEEIVWLNVLATRKFDVYPHPTDHMSMLVTVTSPF